MGADLRRVSPLGRRHFVFGEADCDDELSGWLDCLKAGGADTSARLSARRCRATSKTVILRGAVDRSGGMQFRFVPNT